jgi:histidinol dehydrogenase
MMEAVWAVSYGKNTISNVTRIDGAGVPHVHFRFVGKRLALGLA